MIVVIIIIVLAFAYFIGNFERKRDESNEAQIRMIEDKAREELQRKQSQCYENEEYLMKEFTKDHNNTRKLLQSNYPNFFQYDQLRLFTDCKNKKFVLDKLMDKYNLDYIERLKLSDTYNPVLPSKYCEDIDSAAQKLKSHYKKVRDAEIECEKIVLKASRAGILIEKSKGKVENNNSNFPGVYLIVNNITMDFYIGESQNIAFRKLTHLGNLTNHTHSSSLMQQHFNINGAGVFDFYILEKILMDSSDGAARKKIESFYIQEYKPTYNFSGTTVDLSINDFEGYGNLSNVLYEIHLQEPPLTTSITNDEKLELTSLDLIGLSQIPIHKSNGDEIPVVGGRIAGVFLTDSHHIIPICLATLEYACRKQGLQAWVNGKWNRDILYSKDRNCEYIAHVKA